jgi:hypothetical protein
MKVNIEVDMTPQEARAFLGLPDLASVQQQFVDQAGARMRAAFDTGDPEEMLQAWAPLGGAKAFQAFQKALWDSAAAMTGKRDEK